MISIVRRFKRKIKLIFTNIIKNRNAVINHSSWIILGNQKSGTTVIAKLLSIASDKTLTNDFIRAIPYPGTLLELRYGLISFEDYVERYKYEFSKDIVKEPSLTFFSEELFEHFPKAKYIFIVRNPYQNIRSILNRLKIPGSLQTIDLFAWEELNKTRQWRLNLQSEMIGFPTDSYIEAMAYRWNYAVQMYLENKEKLLLVKYEDFNRDKENYIYELCTKMGLDVVNPISDYINVQYQPKGNRNIQLEEFFGEKNMKKIEKICGENMKKLGY